MHLASHQPCGCIEAAAPTSTSKILSWFKLWVSRCDVGVVLTIFAVSMRLLGHPAIHMPLAPDPSREKHLPSFNSSRLFLSQQDPSRGFVCG